MQAFRYISGTVEGQPFDSESEFEAAYESGSRARRGIGRMFEDCDAAAAEGVGGLANYSHTQSGGLFAYDLGTQWAYLRFENDDTARPVIVGVFSKPVSRSDQTSLAAR